MKTDKKTDILAVNQTSFNMSVLIGDGGGSFTAGTAVSVGQFPRDLVIADFDGDGNPDAATNLNGQGLTAILIGGGDGSFKQAKTYTSGASPIGLASADMNADGKPDLVAALNGEGKVAVLLNKGDGTFATTPILVAVGPNPRGVAVADLNGDERPDIVSADEGLGTNTSISVVLNKAQ